MNFLTYNNSYWRNQVSEIWIGWQIVTLRKTFNPYAKR